jgi:hypothetical protein
MFVISVRVNSGKADALCLSDEGEGDALIIICLGSLKPIQETLVAMNGSRLLMIHQKHKLQITLQMEHHLILHHLVKVVLLFIII